MKRLIVLLFPVFIFACGSPKDDHEVLRGTTRKEPTKARFIIGGSTHPPASQSIGVRHQNALVSFIWRIGTNQVMRGCTGTLVRPNHILTAAHCVLEEASEMWAVFGPSAGQALAEVRIVETYPHPGYEPRTVLNDIAVLEISPEDFRRVTRFAEPWKLALDSDAGLRPGQAVLVGGFGKEVPAPMNDPRGNHLRRKWLELTLNTPHGGNLIRPMDPGLDIWLEPSVQGTGICYGDSGGPALLPGSAEEPAVFGVASMFVRRAPAEKMCVGPVNYSSVAGHAEFIRSILEN